MTDEDQGWEIDDGGHDLDDEPGYDHYDRDDDYEPSEPDFDAIAYHEHAEYLASLSPLGRAVYEVRDFIRRRTWRLRMWLGDRWRQMAGRAADFDDPPF
ncbi:MAG TPA: hypothetical protein VIZ43_08415 [Trebonia sp.]